MKQKMLIVDCNLKIGGIQKALINLLKQLHDIYDVTLLLFYPAGSLIDEVPKDVRVLGAQSDFRYMGMAQENCAKRMDQFKRAVYVLVARLFGQKVAVKLASWTLLRDRKQLETEYDIAISYSHMAPERTFFSGTAPYVLEVCKAALKCCYIHCDYQNSGNRSAYSDEVYRRFDRIFCVSESVRRRFLKALPELKEIVLTCPNAVDEKMILRMAEDSPYVYDASYINLLTVARLTAEKGVRRVIGALAQVKSSHIRYYVVGDGKERKELEAYVAAQGLTECIFFLGETDNPYRYMQNADWLVVPSYHEAAPVVFQEAKVLKLPILTTRTTSADEMIGTEFGMVVENSDEAIYDAMRSILHQAEER